VSDLDGSKSFGDYVIVRWLVERDLLASLLFEGANDLPDRRVLLRAVALLPLYDEVGSLSTRRGQG
jgi:hypothetical protein